MSVLPIVMHPNDILRRKARPVQKINATVRRLLDDMAETMYAALGVGLAAPQVGVARRVIVVDCGEPHGLIELINPEVTGAEGQMESTEGCLSIPGYVGQVTRRTSVRVTGLDRHGRRLWLDAAERLATCLQHEIDHLDGVLYIDKATRVWELPAEAGSADDPVAADPPEAMPAVPRRGEE